MGGTITHTVPPNISNNTNITIKPRHEHQKVNKDLLDEIDAATEDIFNDSQSSTVPPPMRIPIRISNLLLLLLTQAREVTLSIIVICRGETFSMLTSAIYWPSSRVPLS